ncbi:hypothetical protein [Pseudonocardia humida]|uniref:hypothetical protein n=1 Tax=Pseudonocardia humida TaxID=2800819 RepID=UPI0027E31000|nr:hypothetical protein [Pseudonocardia humida]
MVVNLGAPFRFVDGVTEAVRVALTRVRIVGVACSAVAVHETGRRQELLGASPSMSTSAIVAAAVLPPSAG